MEGQFRERLPPRLKTQKYVVIALRYLNLSEEMHLGYEPLTMKLGAVTIYGLHAYGSLFQMRINKDTLPYTTQGRRVFHFKKSGTSKQVFKELIERFSKDMNADKIIAVPSSSTDKISQLQQLFGNDLRRIEDSPQRKYHHTKPVEDSGKVVLDSEVSGKKIVLVDDIVTTGSSMLFFRRMLKDAGASEVCLLGIGLNLKKSSFAPPFEVVDEIFKKTRQELREDAKKEPEDEPEEDDDSPFDLLESALMSASQDLRSSLESPEVLLSGELAEKFCNACTEMKENPETILQEIVKDFLHQ